MTDSSTRPAAPGQREQQWAISPAAATLLQQIDTDLPALAHELVPQAPSVSDRFLANPDDPAEHKPEWHEFGIITHTRQFVAALQTAVPAAIQQVSPAILQRVTTYLNEQIDGLTRWELTLIAGYWHDAGKFTTRTLGRNGSWRFIGHAHDSARLITGVQPDHHDGLGARYHLTAAQTSFVARLADLHYAPMELKIALDRARVQADDGQIYAEIANRLGAEGYAVCCHFWADCLAKGSTERQLRQRPDLWDLFVATLQAVDQRLQHSTLQERKEGSR